MRKGMMMGIKKKNVNKKYYLVEKIVKRRIENGKVKWLIKQLITG